MVCQAKPLESLEWRTPAGVANSARNASESNRLGMAGGKLFGVVFHQVVPVSESENTMPRQYGSSSSIMTNVSCGIVVW